MMVLLLVYLLCGIWENWRLFGFERVCLNFVVNVVLVVLLIGFGVWGRLMFRNYGCVLVELWRVVVEFGIVKGLVELWFWLGFCFFWVVDGVLMLDLLLLGGIFVLCVSWVCSCLFLFLSCLIYLDWDVSLVVGWKVVLRVGIVSKFFIDLDLFILIGIDVF